MMNEFEQFEQDLRSLVPIRCEHLAEETFYQAGWAAAAKQFEPVRLQTVDSLRLQSRWYRHPLAVFSSGMAFGLMFFAAVLNGTNNRGDQDEHVAGIANRKEVDSGVADTAAGAILNPVDEVHARLPGPQPTIGTISLMIASVFPWSSPASADASATANSPAGALSRAAQHRWNSLLQPEHVTCRHSPEAVSDVTTTESRPLQVSPLRNGMMKEFL